MNWIDPELRAKMERFKRRPCVSCGAGVDYHYMTRTITHSGIDQFRWKCGRCSHSPTVTTDNIDHEVIDAWIASGFIPHKEDIEIIRDNRGELCAICGAIGVELHHWAPQSLRDKFGDDWNKWPTVYLCRFHHRQWHEIVTPQIYGFGGKERTFYREVSNS